LSDRNMAGWLKILTLSRMGFNDFLKKRIPVQLDTAVRLNGYAMGGMLLKDKTVPLKMANDKVYPSPLTPNPKNVLQPAFVRDSIH